MENAVALIKPLVNHWGIERPVNWKEIFSRNAPLYVEIGSGMGEVLVKNALEKPDADFVGIEQIWERVFKTFKRAVSSSPPGGPANLKILRCDVRDVLERYFKEQSIDGIYCLFPCPWPKKSHIKHRLFSADFLRLANNRLKMSAELKIVTDFEPYALWVKDESYKTGFDVSYKCVWTDYDTKFERKWKNEGKKEFYEIHCVKKNHTRVAVKKDTPLKALKVKNFDSQKFKFTDLTGKTAVVYKEMFYDAVKKIALIHLVVSEGHVVQHVRIAVIHLKDHWLVKVADGQQFIPTPGIAKSIECVYKAIVASC